LVKSEIEMADPLDGTTDRIRGTAESGDTTVIDTKRTLLGELGRERADKNELV